MLKTAHVLGLNWHLAKCEERIQTFPKGIYSVLPRVKACTSDMDSAVPFRFPTVVFIWSIRSSIIRNW